MVERFRDPGIKVLHASREEALRLGSETVEIEHLWVGLRFEGDVFTRSLMREFGLDLRRFSRELERNAGRSGRRPTPLGRLSFSSHVTCALFAAAGIASEMGLGRIGPEHLLLALLKEDGELGAQIRRAGLTYDLAKARLVKSLGLEVEFGEGFENDPDGACGVCKHPLSPPSELSACPRCRAQYHADCWDYNLRRCAVFGCVRPTRPEGSSAPAINSATRGRAIDRETIAVTLGAFVLIAALWLMSTL